MEQTTLRLHVRKRYLNNGSDKDASPKRSLVKSLKDDPKKLPIVEKDPTHKKQSTKATSTPSPAKTKPSPKQRPNTRQSLRQTRLSTLFERKSTKEVNSAQGETNETKRLADDVNISTTVKENKVKVPSTAHTPLEEDVTSKTREQTSPIPSKRSVEALQPLETKESKRQRSHTPEETPRNNDAKEIVPVKETTQLDEAPKLKETVRSQLSPEKNETAPSKETDPLDPPSVTLEKDTLSIDSSSKEVPANPTVPELASPQPRHSVSTSILWQTEKSRIADEQKTLERLRDALDISLTFHAGHNRVAFFHKIQQMLCSSTQKNITLAHIAKILHLAPELYIVEARVLKEFGRTVETYALHFGKDWVVPLSGKDLEKRKTVLTDRICKYFDTHTEAKATIPEAPLPKVDKVVDTATWLKTAKLPAGVRSLLEMQEQRKKEGEAEKQPRPTPTGTVRERSNALLERIRAKQQQKKDANKFC